MRSLFVRTVLLLAVAPARAWAQVPVLEAPVMPWQVVDHIVTGSVVDVRGLGLVRLAGVDDFGEPSRAFLSGMLSGQAVRVMATNYSEAGLTHALLYAPDGRCVNVEMLRSGYARVRVEPGFDRVEEFRGLQADAVRLKRGMWGAAASGARITPSGADAARADSRAGFRRFHLAGGAGAAVNDSPREWTAAIETDVFLARAASIYVSVGYAVGDRDSEHPWQGSAGLRLISPARAFIRPYLKAGGGFIRIESSGTVHDEPFWEAGGGLIFTAGALYLDAGYTFARVDRADVARAVGLLGVRF